MRGHQFVFCKRHHSRTSYQNRIDLLQYRINLVTRVLVDFQQKTNLVLVDQLDPQIFPGFSACTRYPKWRLFYIVP